MSRAPRPAGAAPASSSASQRRGRGIPGEQDLHPVLARVAGAADEIASAPCELELGGVHPGRQLAVDQPGDDAARLRALHGEHRVVVDPIVDLDVEAARVVAEPGQIVGRGWRRW